MRLQRVISKFRSWQIWQTTSLPINGYNDMRNQANTNDVCHAGQRCLHLIVSMYLLYK